MAYTLEAQLSFSLVDSGGVRGSLNVPVLLDPTKTGTQLAAAWNTQAALLDAATDCKIIQGEVRIVVKGAAMTFTPKSPSPVVGSNIERTANVDWANVVNGALYDSIIPGAGSFILVPSFQDVDETATPFVNYVAPFATPPAEWAASNNVTQRLAAAYTDTFVSFRKHRRQRRRRSLETP